MITVPDISDICRNLIKKPWAYNPKIVGFIQGTLIKAQGFLMRLLHYDKTLLKVSGTLVQASNACMP